MYSCPTQSMKRRYNTWDEVTELREVKSLKKLHHPNVVKLKEVIRYFIKQTLIRALQSIMSHRVAFKLGGKTSFVLCLLVKNVSAVYSAGRCDF